MRPDLGSLLTAEQQRPAADPIDLREPAALASPKRQRKFCTPMARNSRVTLLLGQSPGVIRLGG
jgi:hypothetical protein